METPDGDPAVDWKKYDGANRDQLSLDTLYINNVTQVMIKDYRQLNYALWTDLLIYMTGIENLVPENTPQAPVPESFKLTPGIFSILHIRKTTLYSLFSKSCKIILCVFVYMRVCVSLCICVFVCLCVYACLCVFVYMRVCVSLCICVFVCLCVYACLCVFMYMHVCVSLCICVFVCLCVYACLCVFVYMRVCVSLCTCVFVCLCVYACLCVHIIILYALVYLD